MEIRVLRYFLAVVREGSITRAAESLHVTQPTLSRQLKDLEDELGQKLFIRNYHHITLTEEGRLFRQRAQEIMEMVYKTESEFAAMGNTVGGDIYIGGGESVAMRLIARVMREVQIAYPDIRFHLYSGIADDIMERLDKGMLDFGLLIQPANTAKYDCIDLPAKDTWGVIMRKDSPLATKKTIDPQDLLGLPLIFSSRQIVRNQSGMIGYPEWFGGNFDKLNVVSTYNLIYNAALMVEEGLGYVIGLDHLIHVTGNGNLCFRPLQPKLESGVSIVWKKFQVFSNAAEIFLEALRHQFTQQQDSGE